MNLINIAKAINEEMARAEKKFPEWPIFMVDGAAIVAEEAGELLRAALQVRYEHGSLENVKIEAIQTATMAIRFLKNLPE